MRDNRRPASQRPPDPHIAAPPDADLPLLAALAEQLTDEQVAELTQSARRMLEHPKYRDRG